VYIGYTYCCWWPSVNFVWLNCIWDFLLLEFEVGVYDKMENFLRKVLKLTMTNPQQLLQLCVLNIKFCWPAFMVSLITVWICNFWARNLAQKLLQKCWWNRLLVSPSDSQSLLRGPLMVSVFSSSVIFKSHLQCFEKMFGNH